MKIERLTWDTVIVTYDKPIDKHNTKKQVFKNVCVSYHDLGALYITENGPTGSDFTNSISLGRAKLISITPFAMDWEALWFSTSFETKETIFIPAKILCEF